MMPSCDQIGVPLHFHSSTTSRSASLMSLRILLRVSPRQSPNSAILFEMSSDAGWPWLASDFFMLSSLFLSCSVQRCYHAFKAAHELPPSIGRTLIVGIFLRSETGLLHADMRAALGRRQRPGDDGAQTHRTPAIREP